MSLQFPPILLQGRSMNNGFHRPFPNVSEKDGSTSPRPDFFWKMRQEKTLWGAGSGTYSILMQWSTLAPTKNLNVRRRWVRSQNITMKGSREQLAPRMPIMLLLRYFPTGCDRLILDRSCTPLQDHAVLSSTTEDRSCRLIVRIRPGGTTRLFVRFDNFVMNIKNGHSLSRV
jgi:hypothetical protein